MKQEQTGLEVCSQNLVQLFELNIKAHLLFTTVALQFNQGA
jgi:hypothetical protein